MTDPDQAPHSVREASSDRPDAAAVDPVSTGAGDRAVGARGPSARRRLFVGWDGPVLPRVAELLLDEGRQRGPAERGDGGVPPPGVPGPAGDSVPTGDGEGDSSRIDLRRILVALPVGRAGRRLTELLLDAAEVRGVRILPPEITTVGKLPERLYRPAAPPPDPVLDRSAWTVALQSLPGGDLGVLLADPPEEEDDPGWARLARTVRNLHRDVGAGGWDFEEVAAVCRSELTYSDHVRWEALARVQKSYRRILSEHGRLDREAARRKALSSGAIETDRSVWVVGAVDLPPMVRRFVLALEEDGRTTIVVPAPESFGDRFDGVGTVRSEAFSPNDLPDLDDRIRVLPGPGEQADAVLDILASLPGRFGPEEITLGAPDPDVTSHLVERLSARGVPVRTPPGRPVTGTSLFRLLAALGEYLDGREFEAFASLIRHPALEGALLRRTGRPGTPFPAVLADRYHGLHLPARLEEGRLPDGGESDRRPVEPGFRRVRDELGGLLKGLSGERPLGEWAGPTRDLLVDLLGYRPLDRAADPDRETLEVAGRIRGLLEGYEDLPPELSPRVTAPRALRLLLEDLRDGEPVPPRAEEGAVEVLGWLELALDDAPVLLVTGVNEPHVPQAVTADLFLPHELRRKLGLLDNEGRWARDLVHLRLMVESRNEEGRHVRLLAGRRDGEGDPLRLSRLLLGGTPQEVARRLVRFLGQDEEETSASGGGAGRGEGDDPGTGDSGPAAADSGRPTAAEAPGRKKGAPPEGEEGPSTGFDLPPEPLLQAPAPPEQIYVTRFRQVLEDPYLYALGTVLRLESVEDAGRELDPMLFGNVIHDVLQQWGESDAASSADEKVIRGALESLLEKELRDRFGARPLPAVRLQEAQLRTRLGAFARWQAEHRALGWRVAKVESGPAAGVPFDVDGSPILLNGRIDRVDHHPEEGRWLLLDYKSGEKARKPDDVHRKGRKSDRRWVDLQLPLYRLLAPFLEGEEGTALIPADELGGLELGYVVLPRDRDRTCLHLAEWTDQELAEADETAREVVRVLRQNLFRFDPATTKAWPDDPIARVLGQGVLNLYKDEGGQDD